MNINFIKLTGHCIGFVSTGLFVYSYQRSKKRKLLIIQTIATALSCIQYLLIGAFSGFALNIVCIIRNFVFYYRDINHRKDWTSPIILSLIMGIASLLSWEGIHSLLITFGLIFNTMCMGMFGAKNFRKTILASSLMILIYNIFAGSYSGIINESLSIISVIIGIIRYNSSAQKYVIEQKT